MKYLSLFYCFLLLGVGYSLGQTPVFQKVTYKILIKDSSLPPVKGYLLDMADSSLKVGIRLDAVDKLAGNQKNFKEVNYQHISEIALKRRHGAGRGAWKGAVIGLLAGVIAGLNARDDPPEYLLFGMSAEEKKVLYIGAGGGAGAAIGALIGALAKKRFIISGSKERFDEFKSDVLTKVYGRVGTK